MNKDEFINHLYKNIWKHIISDKGFDYYWSNTKEREYFPDEHYSESIPSLIQSLNENCDFYRECLNNLSYLDNELRSHLKEFLVWYKAFEHKTPNTLFNEFQNNELMSDTGLDDMMKYVEKQQLEYKPSIENLNVSNLQLIEKILNKFTSASKSLLDRRKGKTNIQIEDEYDIQDLLFIMLKPHFPTLRIEQVVSGNDDNQFLKIDFLISSNKVAIECKIIRDQNHANKISKELNDDIQTYHNNQDCNTLIFFIYDKSMLLNNPDVLLESYNNIQTFNGKELKIITIIKPQN